MKKTAFLCLVLAAVLYFTGSFWQLLTHGQSGMPGCASARGMAGAQGMDRTLEQADEMQGQTEDYGAGSNGNDPDEQALIKEFEIVRQMPELPTGCEVTALTMMLNYYGCQADKTVMAEEYLPTAPAEFYEGADGRRYGPDMEAYFVGDPFSSGYICGTEAILSAADAYLSDQGSSLRAEDLTGAAPEELYALVAEATSVLVWITIGMQERAEVQGWYTEDGRWMEWSSNDHGAVLIGYDADTVTIADPLSGLCVYSRKMFEHVFASRGSQCIIISREQPAQA